MQTATKVTTINGVNMEDFNATIEGIKADPEIAKFKFRATNRWVDGAEGKTSIKGYYGTGKEFVREDGFSLINDEAPVLLGKDAGPNPVEYALAALAGCLTTSLVYHAAAQGIKLDSVESSYEGDIDLQGFTGLDPNVRNGYSNIRVTFRVKGDASDEKIRELVEIAQQRSPVFDIVTNKTPVTVNIAS